MGLILRTLDLTMRGFAPAFNDVFSSTSTGQWLPLLRSALRRLSMNFLRERRACLPALSTARLMASRTSSVSSVACMRPKRWATRSSQTSVPLLSQRDADLYGLVEKLGQLAQLGFRIVANVVIELNAVGHKVDVHLSPRFLTRHLHREATVGGLRRSVCDWSMRELPTRHGT